MRFRCVCKSWHVLISDSYFVKKHFSYVERGITVSPQKLMFMLDPPLALDCEALESIKDDLIHDKGDQFVTQLDFPVTNINGHRVLIGACNGLVCVEQSGVLMLWNPSTRDSKFLPKPPQYNDRLFYGFGYDSANDDYKVIKGVAYHSKGDGVIKLVIHIYSLKRGSWRTIKDIEGLIIRQGLYLNGALHWLGGSKISSFDLGSEIFHNTIPLPYDDLYHHFHDPLVHKNCLCLLARSTGTNSSFSIWMMKEYGVKESWTEIVQFSLENYVMHNFDSGRHFKAVCILENGLVWINDEVNDERLIVVCNVKEKTFKQSVEVAKNLRRYRTISYRETIVSPNNIC